MFEQISEGYVKLIPERFIKIGDKEILFEDLKMALLNIEFARYFNDEEIYILDCYDEEGIYFLSDLYEVCKRLFKIGVINYYSPNDYFYWDKETHEKIKEFSRNLRIQEGKLAKECCKYIEGDNSF